MDNNDESETCWICLEGAETAEARPGPLHANRLLQPCRCPRVVHSVCLAKWQLSQSGKSEEKYCRFCKERLPDWQENLALPGMAAVEPVMSVHFNGQTHMVKVKPGEEGRLAFIADVRRLLRLRENQEFSITFECKVPGHGMFLDLKGLSSYDAAVFCAAMTAVERQRLAAQKAQKAAAGATASGGLCVPGGLSGAGVGTLASTGGIGGGSTLTGSGRTGLTASRSLGRGGVGGGSGGGAGSLRRDAASLAAAAPGSVGSSASSDSDGTGTGAEYRRHHRTAPSLILSDSDAGSGSGVSEAGTLHASNGRDSLTRAAAADVSPVSPASSTARSAVAGASARMPTSSLASAQSTIPAAGGVTGALAGPSSGTAGSGNGAAAASTSERAQPRPQRTRGLEQRSHGACEVEPAAAPGLDAAGEAGSGAAGGGGASAGAGASLPLGGGASAADRRKAHRHGWQGLALGGGGHAAAAAAAAAGSGGTAAAEVGPAGGQGGAGVTWLSRLFTCGGFGAVAVYEPSR